LVWAGKALTGFLDGGIVGNFVAAGKEDKDRENHTITHNKIENT
jgi:hypothetical protein